MAVTKHARACGDGEKRNTVLCIFCVVAAYTQRLSAGMERLGKGRVDINWGMCCPILAVSSGTGAALYYSGHLSKRI